MTPEQLKLLQDLGRTNYGHVLRIYLEKKQAEIGDIMACPSSLDELRGRQFALKLIEDLFSFMETKKQSSRVKNQYE